MLQNKNGVTTEAVNYRPIFVYPLMYGLYKDSVLQIRGQDHAKFGQASVET